MKPSGIEPATFWLVAQCLNQLLLVLRGNYEGTIVPQINFRAVRWNQSTETAISRVHNTARRFMIALTVQCISKLLLSGNYIASLGLVLSKRCFTAPLLAQKNRLWGCFPRSRCLHIKLQHITVVLHIWWNYISTSLPALSVSCSNRPLIADSSLGTPA